MSLLLLLLLHLLLHRSFFFLIHVVADMSHDRTCLFVLSHAMLKKSSPRQSVSITFSVCFPFVSSRLYSVVVFILSSTSCPTCSTIELASSFACVRCPGCSSSVYLPVSTSFFTLISENSPYASIASASVFSFLACAVVFVGGFFFALTQFFVCGFRFFIHFSMISWYLFSSSGFLYFTMAIPFPE